MLRRLYIRNFALLVDESIEFSPGFNVLTGETGAGKSIIIGALGLVLGKKGDTTVIRKGEREVEVVAVFENLHKNVRTFLEERSIESDELVIRRVFGRGGRNVCTVNETPVRVGFLRDLGRMLVDVHSQFAQHNLMREESHIDFVDDFGKLWDLRARLEVLVDKREDIERRIAELVRQKEEWEQRRDLYLYQLKEIEDISPCVGEDEELVQRREVLSHYEKLREGVDELLQVLGEGDYPLVELVGRVHNRVEEMASYDSSLLELLPVVRELLAGAEEVHQRMVSYSETLSFDPLELEEVCSRLDAIERLKKKYGGSIEAVLAYRDELKERMDEEGGKFAVEEEMQKLKEVEDEISKVAEELTTKREECALGLAERVKGSLLDLGFSSPAFEVRFFQKDRIDRKGAEDCAFYIGVNPGEGLRPLVKVASGGELSRIMLAMKEVLSSMQRVPVLVLDEIEVGIGGLTAEMVGKKIKGIAQKHQVICITHLPQIAALADRHLVVEKQVKGGRTFTSIFDVKGEERVAELARMLGGESALSYARRLLGDS